MAEDEKKVLYGSEDMVAVKPPHSLDLPDIDVVAVFYPKDKGSYYLYYCEPTEESMPKCCPDCKSTDIDRHGYTARPRLVHDASIRNTRIDLALRTPRYICNNCGGSFNHQFDFLVPGQCMTERLKDKIRNDCFYHTFTDMAIDSGFSEGNIRNICDQYWDELEQKRGPIVAPRVLGIDEKHISHNMRAIFVDIETGHLLEIRPNNKEEDIIGTIESMVDYDKNIKLVTIDMALNYRANIQMCLPYAKIIVDKYHVYQDLYRKLTTAKKAIMEEIGRQLKEVEKTDAERYRHLYDVRDIVLKNSYLFKFGRAKLEEKPSRLKAMAEVCATFPELNHLRLLKEGFERIYAESRSREEAEVLYEEWTKLLPPTRGSKKVAEWELNYGVNASLYKELNSFNSAVKQWHTEIFNYFDEGCQFTNAASEGTNSKIQRINALGAGYGFKHLRARALFVEYAGPKKAYNFSTDELNSLIGSNLCIDEYVDEKKKEKKSHRQPKIAGEVKPKKEEKTTLIVGNRLSSSRRHTVQQHRRKLLSRDALSVLAYIDTNDDYFDFADGA